MSVLLDSYLSAAKIDLVFRHQPIICRITRRQYAYYYRYPNFYPAAPSPVGCCCSYGRVFFLPMAVAQQNCCLNSLLQSPNRYFPFIAIHVSIDIFVLGLVVIFMLFYLDKQCSKKAHFGLCFLKVSNHRTTLWVSRSVTLWLLLRKNVA